MGDVMKMIELDSSGWKNLADFGNAVHRSLGAPLNYNNAHIDALLEAIYWDHAYADLNQKANEPYIVAPPFTLKVRNSTLASPSVRNDLLLIQRGLEEAHQWFLKKWGRDVDIRLEIA